MARAVLTPVSVTMAGAVYALAAVNYSDGNHFLGNDGNCVLLVSNGSGGDLTVTIQSNGSGLGGLTLADQVPTVVATGTTRAIKIAAPAYVTQSDGYTQIDWSTGTSVTAVVLKVA